MREKGLSPVIATVLLIAMVIVIGMVIFLWFRSFNEEAITKFDKNIKLVCEDAEFDASYSGGLLYISNKGNVPIFGMKLKISGDGSHTTIDLSEWPKTGLNPGATFSDNLQSSIGDATEIVLIPVLIGSSDSGEKTFMCDEKQHGYEIEI